MLIFDLNRCRSHYGNFSHAGLKMRAFNLEITLGTPCFPLNVNDIVFYPKKVPVTIYCVHWRQIERG